MRYMFIPTNNTYIILTTIGKWIFGIVYLLFLISKSITKLVLVSSGKQLVSASDDATCCVWDIQSKQVVSTIRHKGWCSLVHT